MLLKVIPSPKKNKRLRAVFELESGKIQNIDFGFKNLETGELGSTYIDHKRDDLRQAYIRRHSPREAHLWEGGAGRTASSLSRFLLWEKPTLSEAIKAYKKRFGY